MAKLKRVIGYLNDSKQCKPQIGVDSLPFIILHAESAFVVHSYFKSHTGAVMTMVKGAVKTISRKHKLNTNSSTETEFVGVDDASILILWTKIFIE